MLKRLFDIVASLVLLIVLSPIYIVISIIVAVKIGLPVFFTQDRPGTNSKVFKLFKFRTMAVIYGEDGQLLPDALRLSSFGSKLRSTSLDELPSLWNVLKGDMSLVGPRPLLVEYLPLYSQSQARRHDVRPGVTGWAQVNGRNAIEWEEKFKLDVWYVDNQSFWLDIKILFLTVKKVVVKDGINPEGEVSMTKFTGTKV